MKTGFGASIVIKVTGVTRMQLEHWDRTGIIQPSIRRATGKGNRKAYSFEDLIALKVALGFRSEGIGLQKIKATINYLRQHFPDVTSPLSEFRFITNGVDIFVITDDSEVILNCLKGQLVFSFAIGDAINELRGTLINLEIPQKRAFTAGGRDYTAILEPDFQDGGYTVTCLEIPAAISQGETFEEAIENIRDAVELCLEHIGSGAVRAAVN